MRILVDNRTRERLPPLSLRRLSSRAEQVLRLPRRSEVTLGVVTAAAMRALNRRTRRRDRATDVLSFPLHPRRPFPPDPDGVVRLGDVVIALPEARRRARAEKRTLTRTLQFLLAHGVLHLVGYDHGRRRDAAVMASLEETLLREIR